MIDLQPMKKLRKLIQYPDRRVKPIVLVMISSGIRVSSWSYLTWGDFTPIYKNDKLIAAKIKVFNTKDKKLLLFIRYSRGI